MWLVDSALFYPSLIEKLNKIEKYSRNYFLCAFPVTPDETLNIVLVTENGKTYPELRYSELLQFFFFTGELLNRFSWGFLRYVFTYPKMFINILRRFIFLILKKEYKIHKNADSSSLSQRCAWFDFSHWYFYSMTTTFYKRNEIKPIY